MAEEVSTFYNSLAESYHLLFADWDQSIERQARTLSPLLTHGEQVSLKILDCACGIGTQSLGLAARGHRLVGSDLSSAAVARARREAEIRGLAIDFHVSDMTSLEQVPETGFDRVLAMDNALPHLTPEQLGRALATCLARLRPGGEFIASIRDYDAVLPMRPACQEPAFFGEPANDRIVHQVWDWQNDQTYIVHLFLTMRDRAHWTTRHFTSVYHCLTRADLSKVLFQAGFAEVQWLMPVDSGYYQPLVIARR